MIITDTAIPEAPKKSAFGNVNDSLEEVSPDHVSANERTISPKHESPNTLLKPNETLGTIDFSRAETSNERLPLIA